MEKIFISEIKIEKVRHLENISIALSKNELKHLIITGKNGSGKTSLLDAMARFLNSITESEMLIKVMGALGQNKRLLDMNVKNS